MHSPCASTVLLATALALAPGAALAQSRPTLFNPTPHDAMRDLSTDRPDRTESPYTVPAGRFQFEFDVANHEREASRGATTSQLLVGAANLKVGLLHNVDLQFGVVPYARARVQRVGQPADVSSGSGDITARAKVNLWGNDGGTTAFGMIPWVSLSKADAGDRRVSAGVILPLSIDAGGGWGVGTMLSVGREPRDAGDGSRTFIESSVTAGHAIAGPLSGYVEFWNVSPREAGAQWQATADAGVTWAIGDNLQLDAGVNRGLNAATPDLNVLTGFTVRF